MSIKSHVHYEYYLNWLDCNLRSGKLNVGQYKLMKISESYFLEFSYRYNNEPRFKQSQDKLYISIHRDKIIDDIFPD